ncbi:MAG: glutaminyl-peptide cyclotransferase [Bacteroidetes bacterium]|nr:glutaminyl-peptide cyclotransferase [Bacteroidota bacterium]
MKKILPILFLLTLVYSCSTEPKKSDVETVTPKKEELVQTLDYEIIGKIPHSLTSFTEGLLFHKNQLFESTGSPENLPDTKSVFGIIDTVTGSINKKAELDKKYFGEGIIIINDKIYQLTYKNQIGFIYDTKTYKQIGQFSYKNKEGWGMTTDGTSIIMSDGTNILTYMDPNTLKVTKTINVTNAGYAEDYLNELEFIKGYIYANIWTKNYVVKIDINSGKVVGVLDFSSLSEEAHTKNPDADVLNGIAYDPATDRMFATGKLFPYIYVIKLK